MRRQTRGMLVGLVAGVVTVAVAEVMRPRPGSALLIDWEEIRRRAKERLPDAALAAQEKQRLADHYNQLAAELAGPLLEVVGGGATAAQFPPFDALSRHEWLDLNLDILSRTLEPLMEAAGRLPNSRIVELSRAGLDRYVAMLLTFLGRRVLGQFDPQLLGREALGPLELGSAEALYLVEPNIVAWQEAAELPPEELRRWLILHEMTHAWQFAAHPWLRRYLDGMLHDLIGIVNQRGDALGRLLSMTVGVREQWGVVRQMQAAMTLIEGYSNLVMNQLGSRLLPGYEGLEAAYRERSGTRTPLEDLFWKVTGLDMKMQQYRRGERFCQEVFERYGMEVLNRAWEGPETLPRLDEYDHPERWYARVGGLQLA